MQSRRPEKQMLISHVAREYKSSMCIVYVSSIYCRVGVKKHHIRIESSVLEFPKFIAEYWKHYHFKKKNS